MAHEHATVARAEGPRGLDELELPDDERLAPDEPCHAGPPDEPDHHEHDTEQTGSDIEAGRQRAGREQDERDRDAALPARQAEPGGRHRALVDHARGRYGAPPRSVSTR